MYTNSQILLSQTGGDQGLFGNPNLEAEKSIQYELGLKQEIFDGTAIELTGYYKIRVIMYLQGLKLRVPPLLHGIYYNRDFSKSLRDHLCL